MDRPPARSKAPMSLEALLDEENREVLAALDRKRTISPVPKARGLRTATPPPPVRSMLDVASPTPRHGSIAGIGVGITSPDQSRKPSALDPSDPSTYTSPHASKPSSPVLTKSQPASTRPRTSSETDRPGGLPRIESEDKRGFEQNYLFDMASIPSSARTATRSPTETKRPREGSSSAMAAAMSGDFASLHVGLPSGGAGRHNSTAATGSHSRSPSSRIRIAEPAKPAKPAFLSPKKASAPLTTNAGTVVDDQAHRRLSNKSSSFSTITDDSEAGVGHIHKDEVPEDQAVADSSDEDIMSPSSDEDETRGRSEKRKISDVEADNANTKSPDPDSTASPEADIKSPPVQHSVRSLLEPSISITSPTGEDVPEEKPSAHPSTNFAGSSSTSVALGDDEDDELAAIRKAKTLALNISPLDSTVRDRVVRIILRGNWAQFDQEAKAGERHNRLYLVCSDLSMEASYAMEWIVGTMLRDGDTILAIYAIEDETAGKATEADREALQAEGVKAGKDASDVMKSLTRQTTQGGGTSFGAGSANKYVPATEMQSLTGSVDARSVSKKEMERLRAVDDITQNFLKLVRKTTLQVRCMVEVIHCKSPKHLILGAIDELEPTLCVVGTRGRSSLKGVLLGSFSNYLVTKSSVPVMVARKRLKKPRSGIRVSSTRIRLSNNLTASTMPTKRRSLTQARID